MSRFVISDLHFEHRNIITFNDDVGKPIRPFDTVEQMNDFIVSQWNDTVHDKDTVYVLGDVSMSKKGLNHIGKLKGRKILIKGNHDLCQLKEYAFYFSDIRACHAVDTRAIMTHIPIHPDCLGRFGFNIHGHLHTNFVTKFSWVSDDAKPYAYNPGQIRDERYINVCVEQTDYKPVEIEQLLKEIK